MSWYVHVQGPDDVIDADSEADANAKADAINEAYALIAGAHPPEYWPTVRAVPTTNPRGVL